MKIYSDQELYAFYLEKKLQNPKVPKISKDSTFINPLKTQENWFFKAFLFFCGLFLLYSIMPFVLLLEVVNLKNEYVICALFFVLSVIASEVVGKKLKHYQNGIDNAFVLSSIVLVGLFFGMLLKVDTIWLFLILFFVSMLSYFRYLHLTSLLIAWGNFYAFVVYSISQTVLVDYLPFLTLIIWITLFVYIEKIDKKQPYIWHSNGVTLSKIVVFGMLYLSCNYAVVREGGQALLNQTLAQNQEIDGALFFYLFTVLTPFLMLYYAVKKKDRWLLWTSILAILASLYTIRMYHSVLPIEWAMLLGGTILLAISLFLLFYLKKTKNGFTSELIENDENNWVAIAETLAIIQQSNINGPSDASKMPFGGGGFSGSGSGGDF